MAAAVGSFGADVAEKGAAAIHAKLEELADDPVYSTGKSARKWGAVALGGGILSFILAQVGKQLDQSYLNDITNTLGLPQQAPPTQGSPAAPAAPPAPPPIPPQIAFLNQIVYDLNCLGTTSAAANVAVLQDALQQLWNLAQLVYGVTPPSTTPTQSPVTGTNPTGSAAGLGPQLSIAIMQTCLAIQSFEGSRQSGPDWWGPNWVDIDVYSTGPSPGGAGQSAYAFLSLASSQCMAPFVQIGPSDWGEIQTELSSQGNASNFKQTVNGIAFYLNATLPFNVSNPSGGNFWGVLGTLASDLGAVGAAIASGVEQAGSDIVAFGKDVAQFAGDIGQALGFIGKVILNLPRLGFDAIGFTFWWGVDMVANAIWLPLVVVGVALLAYSTFALNVYPRIKTRLVLAVKARTAATWARFDTRFRSLAKARVIRADKAKEVVLEAAIEKPVVEPQVVTPPNIEAGLPAEPQRSKPEEAGGAVSATELAPAPEQPPEAPARPMESPTPPAPPVETTPTETTEAMLGGVEPMPEDSSTRPAPENALAAPPGEPTPAELGVQEANRQDSLPPSYRERKRETERERSEKMLADLNGVFA